MKVLLATTFAAWVFATTASCRPAQPEVPSVDSVGNLEAANCDSKPDWSASTFLKEDCYASVLDVFLQDYRPHPQSKFNFYSSLFPPPLGSNMMQTPRRYTTSTYEICTDISFHISPWLTIHQNLAHSSWPCCTNLAPPSCQVLIDPDMPIPISQPSKKSIQPLGGWKAIALSVRAGPVVWHGNRSVSSNTTNPK